MISYFGFNFDRKSTYWLKFGGGDNTLTILHQSPPRLPLALVEKWEGFLRTPIFRILQKLLLSYARTKHLSLTHFLTVSSFNFSGTLRRFPTKFCSEVQSSYVIYVYRCRNFIPCSRIGFDQRMTQNCVEDLLLKNIKVRFTKKA